MSRSLLADAFEHHVWATLRVIDACESLTEEQLATTVPGTFGSIIDTLRHTVGADSWYLHRISDGRMPPIDEHVEAGLDLAGMREAMRTHGAEWSSILEGGLDPDRMIEVRRDDGSETHAQAGLRLAQALHHGTDHRSQICTALTSLGLEPPGVDLWEYGTATGRVTEIPPTA